MEVRARRGWIAAAVLAVALSVFAGCGGSDDGPSASNADGSPAGAPPADSAGADQVAQGPDVDRADPVGGSGDPVDALGGSPLDAEGRSFISTAALHIEADEVGPTSQEAVAVVEGHGGALFGESSTFQGEPTARLTLKVPPERFSEALRDLGELGEVVSQTVDTEDVTERVVDLQSRITTAETSVDRLVGFMADATSVPDLSTLEAELLARETQLETLRGQLRTIGDQIDLATIVLTISGVDGSGLSDDGDSSLPGFLDAVSGSWDALVQLASIGLVLIGVVVPWLPLVALVVLGSWWWRRRDARPVKPEPAGDGAGPSSPGLS